MGNADRNPANENPDEIFRGRKKRRKRSEPTCKKAYFASDEKIDLSIDIAERELEILKNDRLRERLQSLYRNPILSDNLPVLFVYILPISELETESGQLSGCFGKNELDYVAVKFGKKASEFHLHWRGETPTTLEPYQLDRLIRKIPMQL